MLQAELFFYWSYRGRILELVRRADSENFRFLHTRHNNFVQWPAAASQQRQNILYIY